MEFRGRTRIHRNAGATWWQFRYFRCPRVLSGYNKPQKSLELIDVCLRNGIEDVFERRKMWMISHHQETIIGLNHLSIKYTTISTTRLIFVVVYRRIGKWKLLSTLPPSHPRSLSQARRHTCFNWQVHTNTSLFQVHGLS